MRDITIPSRRGASFDLVADEAFEIVDPNGGQVADLVAFDLADRTERFSPKYTYVRTQNVVPTVGDTLYTTEGRPILTITADDCGVHDLFYSPCTEWIIREFYDRDGYGCRENLAMVLSSYGVREHQLNEAFNVFMNTHINDGEIGYETPASQPGDMVRFRVERDAVVGVSACASESAVNDGNPGPIDVRVPDGTTLQTNFR